MRETADSTAVVFPIYQMAVRWVNKFEKRGRIPCSSGDTWDPVLGSDFTLIDGYLGEVASVLVPFEGVGGNGRDVDVAAKVTREIAEMGSLFDDGARAERDM